MALEKANHLFHLKKKKQPRLFIHLFSHWKKQTTLSFNYVDSISFIFISGTWRLKKQKNCELQAKNPPVAFASAPQRTNKKTESFLFVKTKSKKRATVHKSWASRVVLLLYTRHPEP
jgi:hypothetical protein